MSQDNVERVIGRLVTDEAFRRLFRGDAIAVLRAKTIANRIPSRSRQRNSGRGGVSHAIAAANSANGSANSVWLKRIISRMCTHRRSIPITAFHPPPTTDHYSPHR